MPIIDVRGQKLRTQTQRRYVVVRVRPAASEGAAFARVVKRSDNLETARRVERGYCPSLGAVTVVVDLRTGQEV